MELESSYDSTIVDGRLCVSEWSEQLDKAKPPNKPMATSVIFFRAVRDLHRLAVTTRQFVGTHAVFSPVAALYASYVSSLVDSAGRSSDADAQRLAALDASRSC